MLDFVTRFPAECERDERELLDLLASDRAYPHVGARFDLERVADALRLVADGRAVGKVVVRL